MAMDPLGRFLYVADFNGGINAGNISAFTVNATTGALTPVAGSPFPGGGAPSWLVVSPQFPQ
jgi:6-phosphogluconolactonase